MQGNLRKTGIDSRAEVPWATHFCHFYHTKQDLIDILVPYFKNGLEDNEFCMWITAWPLDAGEARQVIYEALPDFSQYLQKGQIEILPYTEWYTRGGSFDSQNVLSGWVEKLESALARGYSGLRLSGNISWLEKYAWQNFMDYEAAKNRLIGKHKMLALCSYYPDKYNASEILDIIRNHEFSLLKRENRWELVEPSNCEKTRQALRESEKSLEKALDELRHTKENLEQSIKKYLNMYDSSPVGYLTLDRRGIIREANATLGKLLNLESTDLTDSRFSQFVVEDFSEKFERYFKNIFKTGAEQYCQLLLKRVNCTPFHARMESIAIRSPSGDINQCRITVHDVTERIMAEEASLDREAELSAIFKSTPMLMLMLDSERRVIKTNQAAADFAGQTVAGMIGLRGGNVLHCLHSLDDPRGCGFGPACVNCLMRLTVLDTLETGRRHDQVECKFQHVRDGKAEEMTLLLHTIRPDLPEKKTLVCIQDITERKQAEEDLIRANQTLVWQKSELETVNREIEAFSYSVSHDLRAPLRSMDGFSQALIEDYADKLDAHGMDYLRRIRQGSQTMSLLIDDMLKLSRVTQAEIHYDKVNLSELVKSVADRLKASQPERQVELKIAPEITTRGDFALLRIALQNLLENAWKFTSGCPQAEIEFGSTETTTFFIKDNGAGFDMAYADKLFTPFQRLHSDREYPGNGIGLAIVERIIRRHGGRIWGESKINQGTTFYFTL